MTIVSEKRSEENGEENEDRPPPPDGGWGWVVVFASFMVHLIADGMAYSFGIYVEAFAEQFDASRGAVGMLGSIMLGVTWGSGPICSFFEVKYGCLKVCIAGTVIAFAGFVMSLFAPNIWFMYLSFGIIAGFGLGMAYLPAIVAVSFYFEKQRSLATGLAVCGSGIGTFIFAPLTELLLEHYGWRGTVLILSGILLNCIPCGALFRPVEYPKKKKSDENDVTEESKLNDLGNGSIKANDDEIVEIASSMASSMLDISMESNSEKIRRRRTLSENHNETAVQKTSNGRKDAFYPASLTNSLALFNSNPSLYRKSMTSITGKPKEDAVEVDGGHKEDAVKVDDGNNEDAVKVDDGNNEDAVKVDGGKKIRYQRFRESVYVGLLLDIPFMIFCVSNLLTSIGFCIPYIFLSDRYILQQSDLLEEHADEKSIKTQGAWLLSIIGISNTIGRVVFGCLSDQPWVNRLFLYNTVLVLCGIASILSVVCLHFWSMSVYAFLFGMFIGVYVCLTPVVLIDLLGLPRLSQAFGIVLLFQGIGAVIGPPLGGAVYDLTKNYDNTFYLTGACILVSGAMLYPIPCIQRWVGKPATLEEVELGKKTTREVANVGDQTELI